MSNNNRDKIKIIYKKSIKKQYYKFSSAEKIMEDKSENQVAESTNSIVAEALTKKRKCTKEYYKEELKKANEEIKRLKESVPTPDEVPGFFKVEKVKPSSTKNVRITQVHGSLDGSEILKLRQEIEEKKKSEEDQKKQRLLKKEDNFEKFIRCKDSCICSQNPCLAQGLKQCPVCKNVQKSQCNKSKCKIQGIKPIMIKLWFDKQKERKSDKVHDPSSSEDNSSSFEDEDDISFSREEITTDSEPCCSMFAEKSSYVCNPSIGDWVLVKYNRETYTGVVSEKEDEEWKIRCLIRKRDGYLYLESDRVSVWYEEKDILGKCDEVPILIDDKKEIYEL